MTNSDLDVAADAQAGPLGKRERLIAAAAQRIYEQGVEKTTLADIAAAAGVPLGNVYYYFKTKATSSRRWSRRTCARSARSSPGSTTRTPRRGTG